MIAINVGADERSIEGHDVWAERIILYAKEYMNHSKIKNISVLMTSGRKVECSDAGWAEQLEIYSSRGSFAKKIRNFNNRLPDKYTRALIIQLVKGGIDLDSDRIYVGIMMEGDEEELPSSIHINNDIYFINPGI